tara:strand:+ start:84 stop:389 length:306 start_codon:yes stop_codon:yes gene_type:complete
MAFPFKLTSCPTVNPALQWLEDNQDKSWEDITAASADDETNPSIEPAPLKDGEVAQSLVCEICQKKFRSVAQAEAHGERTYVAPLLLRNGGVDLVLTAGLI